MDRRLNIITLGVADLGTSLRFYRDGLGWPPAFEMGDFALFDLGGVALALHPRALLAADAGVTDAGGWGGITLAQNVASEALVDQTLAAAAGAGGTLLKPGQRAEWGGYSGYFADPDGHPWEVAFNPHFTLTPDGRLTFEQRLG